MLEQSHEVRLIDAQARHWAIENVLQDVSRFNPDIIVVDTNFSSLKNDVSVAINLKIASNAITVLEGPPASQYSEKMLYDGG